MGEAELWRSGTPASELPLLSGTARRGTERPRFEFEEEGEEEERTGVAGGVGVVGEGAGRKEGYAGEARVGGGGEEGENSNTASSR